MRGINKVILIGNATRDAELRHIQTGKSISSIRLDAKRTTRARKRRSTTAPSAGFALPK